MVFGRVRTTVPVPAPPSVELSCLFIKTPSLRQSLIILDFYARGKGLSELNIHAPLYFGYGGEGEYADRRLVSRSYEKQILERAPDTVLVLVKASAEVIGERMSDWPHHNGALQREDIDSVLARFEEEYDASSLHHKIVIDTSSATVEESMAELAEKLTPLLSEGDRNRMKAQGGHRDG